MTQQEFFKRYKYSIRTDKVGGGAFGTVYKAFDEILNREVAIKVSEVKIMGGKEFSLKDEFDAIKDVPVQRNIANYESLHTFESPQGIFDYAVMQFYKDGNLSSFIKGNPTLAQKEQVALDLLAGIHHLHKHSVVHRDLKPGNILIVKRGDKIIPVITDFGLSKNAKMEGQSRFSNSFGGGTLKYSSPEQLKAEKLRLNTDLWAYGVIVYEIFTGKNLFMAQQITGASAEAEKEIYEQIIGVDISEMIKELPSKWQEVVKQCLVRDGAKRIKSTQALKDLILKGETFTKSAASTNDDKTLISEVVSEESMNAQTIVNNNQTTKNEEVKKESVTEKAPPIKKENTKTASFSEYNSEFKKKKVVPFLKLAGVLVGLAIISTIALVGFKMFSKSDWEQAQELNTEQSYSIYIENNPEGEFLEMAKEKLEWIQLDKQSSISLKMFTSNYPQSAQNKTILELLTRIEYDSILSTGSAPSYNFFIDKYPNSPFSDSLKVALSNVEKIEWNKVVKRNTIKDYKKFNKEFPKSIYAASSNNILKTLSWDKTFGAKGKGYEGASSIVQTTDGGYMVVGGTNSKGSGSYDAWILKITSKGKQEWDKTFGEKDHDYGSSIIQTSDGGYMVLGNTDSKGAGNGDIWMIKFNSKGNKQWDKTFGGKGSDYSTSIIQTADGGYMISGETESIGAGKRDFWIIKANNKGIKQWDKNFGGKGGDYLKSVIQTSDGGYMIAGETTSKRDQWGDYWIIKTNNNGDKQWDKTFGSRFTDGASSVIQAKYGGYMVLGSYAGKLRLIKITNQGVQQWYKDFGYISTAKDIISTIDGGYMISGTVKKKSTKDDLLIIKINRNGTKQWEKTFGGKLDEKLNSIIQTADGGYLLAGTKYSKGSVESDAWIIKVDKEGN